MVVEKLRDHVEENPKMVAGLSKSNDKDDTSCDSVCSVFEKMKPYWVRTEVDEQTQHIPISPISSQSCLCSSNNSSSEDSPVVHSPMLKVKHGMEMPMNRCQQSEERNCRLTNNSILNPCLSSSYQTTTMFHVSSPENMMPLEGNQTTVMNNGFYQAATYSWFDMRTYFNAIRWQTRVPFEQQENRMEQLMHPLYNYQPTRTRILPTAEPGDFSNIGYGYTNVARSDQQSMENHRINKQQALLSNHESHSLCSEPKTIKKRHIKLDDGRNESTSSAGKANKLKKCKRENYLRFERWEEENLLRGVEKYGVGKWTSILRTFAFQKKRSAIDLKDKYRNIVRAKRRAHLAQLNAMKL
ncbi:hypothetical protein Gasu2_02740 [Galdieria sulphuraria]|nr:hypothetical protein Gasu2_02740 [Galdieria sulphuraria]